MCDTIVATPAYTKNGKMLFAKNSDRSPKSMRLSSPFFRYTSYISVDFYTVFGF